ncbi:MAG TPA: hypothetical protein VK508_11785 [Cyclobacteriaceae bacterium]|nr:hypothetical protein [Cyclobacteriaceae bacterium]
MKAGVREYWLVDPDTSESYGYLLENSQYGEALQLNSKIHIRILNKTLHF